MAPTQSIDPSDDPEVESVATDYVGVGSLQKELTDAFWNQIEKALRNVFFPRQTGHGLSNALKRLERLKKAVNTSEDPAFPAAVYHLDPFQVAKDLAGDQPATTEQKERYVAMLLNSSNSDRGPAIYDSTLLREITRGSLARAFPDDPIIEQPVP